jgi:hypothetical protein
VVRKVKIYAEDATGGKGKNQSANIAFREGFGKFAAKLGIASAPSFVPCGGRDKTWEVAWAKFVRKEENELILLLVDSEEPTHYEPEKAWQHLRFCEGQSWSALQQQHARFIFMMVTPMETWIAADEGALQRFFGQSYRSGEIAEWPKPESVAKEDVLKALESASSGEHSKGAKSFELIGELDPKAVAAKCPHTAHFCKSLQAFCQ